MLDPRRFENVINIMAELWSLKVQIGKNITQRKQFYIANLRRLKPRLANIIFTSNNFNVISFEINQRKIFSLSDKTHFFSLLYEEKLVISTLQTKCSQWKTCREPFFYFYAGSVNIVQNENNSFEM